MELPESWRGDVHGLEFEGKDYFRRSLFLLGSYSYQGNADGSGTKNITPVPNTSAKAGISYLTENGLCISLFDSYQGGTIVDSTP